MPVPKRSLGSGLLGEVAAEKWLLLAGFVLAWAIPILLLNSSARPTALGLPVWFLGMLGFVAVEYVLVFRLGSHYLRERQGPAAGGE